VSVRIHCGCKLFVHTFNCLYKNCVCGLYVGQGDTFNIYDAHSTALDMAIEFPKEIECFYAFILNLHYHSKYLG